MRRREHLSRMSWEWYQKKIMIEILRRDEFTCQLCGSYQHLQIHHLCPRSKGGDNSEANLLTLCRDCHADVHSGQMTLKNEQTCKL